MGAILALLTGPFGRIILYAVGGLVAAGTIAGVYFSWKHGIETRALAEYNRVQLEQNLKDQQDLARKTQELSEAQQKVAEDLLAQNKELQEKILGINQYLDSEAAKKSDRPSSEVLKETLRRLGGKK